MSDYSSFMDRTPTCSEQIAEASVSLTSRFAQLFEALKTRFNQRKQLQVDKKALSYMMQLDDDLLKDIGISRGDIVWAESLPVNANASLELAKLAMVNRSRMSL